MKEENVSYNYLDLLNPQQRAAVEYTDGPALVIAGAGSGKTRVLTYKVVHLLRLGYEAYRILALTFTNKASREMKERITSIVGERIASRLWMGTFHSVFLRILRHHPEQIGYRPGFTIYDSTDSRSLIKMIIRDLGLDEKVYKPAAVQADISNAKNAMAMPDIYMRDPDYMQRDKNSRRPMTGRIYQLYCERCRLSNAMDFDDILVYTNFLLRDNDDIRRHYQEFFRYVLVDEYQDTNFAQHLVISQLTATTHRLCVVGDDAQSIYSFRGANISNILNLNRSYPELRIFKLERNYRSTQNIIDAAGSLIDKNTRQMKKHVFSENEKGEPIAIVKTYSDLEEAFMVASLISRSKYSNHDSYSDYAVLYRTNAQSRVLEESLRRRNIPYRIYGGLSFYQRKEIKDMVCYFRMAVNPDDDEALRRIINYPARGIGDTTMKKLISAATKSGTSIWSVISAPDSYGLDINSGTKRKLAAFHQLIQEFTEDNARGSNAFELGQLIYNRTGVLVALAHDKTPESISRQENLSELLAGLNEFVDSRFESGEEGIHMMDFLSEVSLSTDMDESDSDDGPKVTLMTVHAAKGLEFSHIYVVGVEDELFPSAMSMNSLAEVEEERRLLYVAITRAKKTCSLLYAGTRFRNGQTVATRPSRFLNDIDRRYLKLTSSSYIDDSSRTFSNPRSHTSSPYPSSISFTPPSGRSSGYEATPDRLATSSRRRMKPIGAQASGAPTTPGIENLKEGSIIEHQRFGRGKVLAVTLMSGERVAQVDFNTLGVKKLLLRIAKIKIIIY